jgi:hypothetical protein
MAFTAVPLPVAGLVCSVPQVTAISSTGCFPTTVVSESAVFVNCLGRFLSKKKKRGGAGEGLPQMTDPSPPFVLSWGPSIGIIIYFILVILGLNSRFHTCKAGVLHLSHSASHDFLTTLLSHTLLKDRDKLTNAL